MKEIIGFLITVIVCFVAQVLLEKLHAGKTAYFVTGGIIGAVLLTVQLLLKSVDR